MNMTTRWILLLLLPVLTFSPSAKVTLAENWSRFRGENGQGISTESDLPRTWSETENIQWKTEIPGEGWSSPIVFNDQIFLTATTEEGVSCRILCVDRVTGAIRWNVEVHRQKPGAKRNQNSYVTPTPVTDGRRVYAAFADGTLVATDFDGKLQWKNSRIKFHSLHGLGSSPVLVNDQVIMAFDGNSPEQREIGWKTPWDQAVVLSLDASTGNVNWEGSRQLSRVGHVTPITVDGGQRIISAAGDRVQAFDSKTGERIWSVYSQGEGVTPSPALGDGIIFTSSGFEEPTIRAIRLGGKGDVTNTHIAWEQKKGVPAMPSPLLVDHLLYTITRDNILHCLKASDGEILWNKRLDGTHSASPVYADGRIYILSETGTTLVLNPGDRYDPLATNPLDEKCLASMAVSQGNFFIRGVTHLYCIGAKPQSDRGN